MKYLKGNVYAAVGAATFLLALLIAPMRSHAQTFRGSISGYVADSSDAVVPNAKVQALSQGTGATYDTVTSSSGQFQFQDMPLGKYQLTISAAGFSSVKIDEIPVSAGVVYSVPVKLTVGEQATTIDVHADQLVLDTATTALTTIIDTQSIGDMPRNGRDYTQNILLIPGSNVAGGSGITSINGGRVNSVNWQMDGTDDNDLWYSMPASNESGVSAIAGTLIPLDAIDQFSFGNDANSDSGRNSSGTANIVIKSGTNTFHGSAYFFDRNEAFAAKSPFLTAKNKIRNENTGMSLGGPIWRDKFFFFLSFEHQGFLIGNQVSSTEPSAAYQAAATNVLNYYGLNVNPLSTNLLANLWPADALTGPASLLNYHNLAPSTGYSNNGVIKVDANLSQKDHLSAKWFYGQGPQRQPNGGYLLPYYEVSGTWVQNYSIIYDRVVSSKLTNQLALGVSYIQEAFKDYQSNYNPVSLGLNTGVTNPALSGAPRISIGPSGSAFDPTGPEPLSGRNNTTGHINETASYSKGAHQLRGGGEFRHAILNEFYQTGQRGTFSFDGTQGPWNALSKTGCAMMATKNIGSTMFPGYDRSDSTTLKSLADFMAGCVSTSNIIQGDRTRQIFVNSFSLFGQDSWQLSHNFNLNYGVRYEYTTPLHNENKDLTVFDPNVSGGIGVAGDSLPTIYKPFRRAISPRVGFSWQPITNGNTVLRGGFGFYYDALWLAPFLNLSSKNSGPFGVQDNPAGNSKVAQSATNQFVWKSGQQIFPPLETTLASTTGVVNLFSVQQDFQPGVTYSFNLNVQQNMGKMGILQIGYVGTLGRHLLDVIDINQAARGSNAAQTSRPYYSRFPNFGVINQLQSGATSTYSSLQATWRSQNWKGFSGQLSYTWAHALDVETGLLPYLPQDSTNLKGNYGNGDFDVRNTFSGFFSYMVPKTKSGMAVKRFAVNGWQLNSTLTFRGGEPFTINASSNVSGNGEFADRANLVGDPFANTSHKITTGGSCGSTLCEVWYNPAAFANPTSGNYGNLRRNQFYSPGYGDVDLSVFKNTPVTEKISTQLRFEMFNLFNRINLSPIGQNATVAGSSIKSTLGTGYGAPGIGLGEPFNMQLAFKVIF
jgi:hypothetical protein